jgi:hypothetical protein
MNGNWVAQVPEPGILMLLGIGLLAVVLSRTRSAGDGSNVSPRRAR